MSGLILVICALAISIQGLNFGIDFEGGTRITVPLEQAATVDQVRGALAPLGLAEAEIQTVENRELGRHVVQINARISATTRSTGSRDALRERFGFADDPSSQSIGASFGRTVAENAIRAIIVSLTIISLYITLRFQWKFAVPALIALAHDLLMTSGVYALTGREVTASTVAALLTILGFSLYDTIVVFDRVRENIPRMPSATFSQIYNRSMAEVIVRSLATSFCASLPILALLLFGGETLQDFAFALLVGMLSGTYSSVFIAGPVLTHWKEREPVYQARETRIRAEFGTSPPTPASRPQNPGSRATAVTRGRADGCRTPALRDLRPRPLLVGHVCATSVADPGREIANQSPRTSHERYGHAMTATPEPASAPPFSPPPPRPKRRTGRIILIVVAAVVALVVVVVIGAFLLVSQSTKDAQKVSDALITAIQTGDGAKAYSLTGPSFRAATTEADLTDW